MNIINTVQKLAARKLLSIPLNNQKLEYRIMSKDDKIVILYGMMHIAPKHYYDVTENIMNKFTQQQILLEGIQLQDSEIKEKHYQSVLLHSLYSKMALLLSTGKTPWLNQHETKLDPSKQYGVPSDSTPEASKSIEKFFNDKMHYFEKTEKYLAKITNTESVSRNLGINDENSKITNDTMKEFKSIALNDRNNIVSNNIIKSEEKQLFVPWGSEHIQGIEKILVDNGYTTDYSATNTIVNNHDLHMIYIHIILSLV